MEWLETAGSGSPRLPTFLSAATKYLSCLMLTFLLVIGKASTAQVPAKSAEPIPEPAISGILAAFDHYEVVAMPQGHGMQDLNDFIFSLVRNPAFAEKVNDIEVQFGNSLYQPVLDRYIAGEDVPFTEVQKVWRKTGQPANGASAFVEQFFPLIRALNRKLPPERRLRVLAGDPAVDWDQIKGIQDLMERHFDRDASIASVMEKEVLSKRRKALMLFGTFHIMHNTGSAVSRYEKEYPNVTLVISELGIYDTDLAFLHDSKFVNWPIPALARAKGTWLGALDLSHFIPPGTTIDQDCNVHHGFSKALQEPMEEYVDALLYLGPADLRLREKIPADIALDATKREELQRGGAMIGFPNGPSETSEQFDQEIVNSAADPFFVIPKPKDDSVSDPQLSKAVQDCLEMKARGRAH